MRGRKNKQIFILMIVGCLGPYPLNMNLLLSCFAFFKVVLRIHLHLFVLLSP